MNEIDGWEARDSGILSAVSEALHSTLRALFPDEDRWSELYCILTKLYRNPRYVSRLCEAILVEQHKAQEKMRDIEQAGGLELWLRRQPSITYSTASGSKYATSDYSI